MAGGGKPCSFGPTPTLTAAQVDALGPGTYVVQLAVTDMFGATNSASTTVTVNSIPTVTSVTSPNSDGAYGVGASVFIDIAFSEPVSVTGTPRLTLKSGGTASYSGGSSTRTLTFTYLVGAGQNSSDLDYTATGALALDGGTILSAANVAANLALPAPGAAGSLGANENIAIDTVAPTVEHFYVMFGSQTYDLISSSRVRLPWQITGIKVVFSEAIVGGDLLSLSGVTATNVSGLGTNTLTWTINTLTQGNFATALKGTGLHALTDAALNSLYGGADYSRNLKVLYGDITDDGYVSSADLLAVYGATKRPYDPFSDLNGDGKVDALDIAIARSRIGAKLP